jgi:hypothetical protein
MYDFNLGEIYDSGALLTRLEADPPQDEWDMDPGHVYWNPHVDKVCASCLQLNMHGYRACFMHVLIAIWTLGMCIGILMLIRYVRVDMYVRVFVCVCVCVCVYIYIYTYACIHTYI